MVNYIINHQFLAHLKSILGSFYRSDRRQSMLYQVEKVCFCFVFFPSLGGGHWHIDAGGGGGSALKDPGTFCWGTLFAATSNYYAYLHFERVYSSSWLIYISHRFFFSTQWILGHILIWN